MAENGSKDSGAETDSEDTEPRNPYGTVRAQRPSKSIVQENKREFQAGRPPTKPTAKPRDKKK